MATKLVKKAIPFSFMHVVRHTTEETTFMCKPFLVEGVGTIEDDPTDDLPPTIDADIDRVFVGQEDIKTELHIEYGHIDPIKAAALDHLKTQFNAR